MQDGRSVFFVECREVCDSFGFGFVGAADVRDVGAGGGGALVVIEYDGDDVGPEIGLAAEAVAWFGVVVRVGVAGCGGADS